MQGGISIVSGGKPYNSAECGEKLYLRKRSEENATSWRCSIGTTRYKKRDFVIGIVGEKKGKNALITLVNAEFRTSWFDGVVMSVVIVKRIEIDNDCQDDVVHEVLNILDDIWMRGWRSQTSDTISHLRVKDISFHGCGIDRGLLSVTCPAEIDGRVGHLLKSVRIKADDRWMDESRVLSERGMESWHRLSMNC